MTTEQSTEFKRPFPALTPSQRYHFDVYGYVVIERVLTENAITAVYTALQQLKADFLTAGVPAIGRKIRNCWVSSYHPYNIHFSHILETDPAILDHVTNPRLIGMAEEIVGGIVRLSETEAIINSRYPDEDHDVEPTFRFHTGTRPGYGSYTGNGLFHSNFVKTLTNVTELGKDDGGTVVIAGSHKIQLPEDQIIACAYEDRSLIHEVVAPAGSTVLFAESLIHATGQIRSSRERTIIITGYTPPMFKSETDQEPSSRFVETAPAQYREYLIGKQQWGWRPRYRSLTDPVQKL